TALPPPVALALTVPRAVVLAVAHTEPRAVAVALALALETDGIVAGDRLRSAPVAAGHDVELVRVQDGLRRLARRARAGQETAGRLVGHRLGGVGHDRARRRRGQGRHLRQQRTRLRRRHPVPWLARQ